MIGNAYEGCPGPVVARLGGEGVVLGRLGETFLRIDHFRAPLV